jgi:hypothetical protein
MEAIVKQIGFFLFACLYSSVAWAWDPVGDLTHPDRIVRNTAREAGRAIQDAPNLPNNVAREVDNVGRQIDQLRLNAQAEAAAPALEAAIVNSRNSAIGSSSPIPPDIRQQIQGFYQDDILNLVRYKIGDAGAFNVAALTLRYADSVDAITLVDLIVFRDANSASDPALWAHELKHVEQYRDWGTHSFAVQYIRSWNGVENPAYEAQRNFPLWNQQRLAQLQGAPPVMPGPSGQQFGQVCHAQMGACFMMQAFPIGSTCICNSPPFGLGFVGQ